MQSLQSWQKDQKLNMLTVTQHIRRSLESKIRPNPDPKPPLEQLRESQWSDRFEQFMRNRLILGAIRYETFDEKRKNNPYNILESIRQRLDLYEGTGNQEHLADIANLAMIEFECPTHPTPNWNPADDGIHCIKQQH